MSEIRYITYVKYMCLKVKFMPQLGFCCPRHDLCRFCAFECVIDVRSQRMCTAVTLPAATNLSWHIHVQLSIKAFLSTFLNLYVVGWWIRLEKNRKTWRSITNADRLRVCRGFLQQLVREESSPSTSKHPTKGDNWENCVYPSWGVQRLRESMTRKSCSGGFFLVQHVTKILYSVFKLEFLYQYTLVHFYTLLMWYSECQRFYRMTVQKTYVKYKQKQKIYFVCVCVCVLCIYICIYTLTWLIMSDIFRSLKQVLIFDCPTFQHVKYEYFLPCHLCG